jgi:hypothetical protein
MSIFWRQLQLFKFVAFYYTIHTHTKYSHLIVYLYVFSGFQFLVTNTETKIKETRYTK